MATEGALPAVLRVPDPERPRRARLGAVGAYLPERVVTNEELSARMATSDEWISARTGIRSRHVAAPEEAASDLAARAAERILERAGLPAAQVDVLIVPTATPDHLLPPTSCLVAERIGASRAACFDLGAVCSGFVYGLVQATALIEAQIADRVLVVSGEVFTRFADFSDRTNAILWGDAGAGALVVAGDRTVRGLLGLELGTDGSRAGLVTVPAGGSRRALHPRVDAAANGGADADSYIRMNGPEIFRFATRTVVESASRVLSACRLAPADLDLVVLHQANLRIVEHVGERLGIARERLLDDVVTHGNTAGASIPLALASAEASGRLRPGQILLLAGFGAGLSWGTVVMAYEPVDGGARAER
jgi:3-oxoacyl-[acyl-carrier-protein] synthase-3